MSTASPTDTGARLAESDSTMGLALVFPRLAPWTRAETLTPYSSGHLPVVFSLPKTGIEPTQKPQHLFKYCESDTGVISKLQAAEPAHITP